MVRRPLATTALVALLALPVYAEPLSPEPASAGTSEEAAALRASLAEYVTQVPFEKGILSVEPDPAGQRVTLNGAPFLKDYFGLEAKVAPLSFLVSPRADGDWNVFTNDPIRVTFDTKVGEQVHAFEYSQGEQVFKGVFAPNLFAYRAVEGFVRDTVNIQNEAATDSSTTIAGTKLSMSAGPGEAGGVDLDFQQTLTDYAQTVGVKAPPPVEGETPEARSQRELAASLFMSFGLKAGEVESTASVKGARNVEGRDLYTLLLAYTEALEADHRKALAGPLGEDLRAALQKTMPFWTSLDVAVTAREASFQSMLGTLRFGEASQATRLTGLAEDARLETDISFDGFSVDGAVVPTWAARFVPKAAQLGVVVSGVDLKAPADLAIRHIDFTADEPFSEEVKAEIVEALDPARIKVTLKPSVIRATDLDLHLSGEMGFVDEKPTGTLTARAVGLDQTIASLQRAAEREPDLLQVVGMAQMAQGLGRKTTNGDWEWVVHVAADGSVSVNGALVKAPDPETLPETETGPAEDAGQQ
ncbi:hypothetical protein [Aureimonas sp. AU40]|uniref:hypothetical protein n=1 Tax=Aureimonas sp. AU40 TaxID=1637747 RepID=UPI0007860D16|nr:hypothetical protein [Aureimonas sp. AU40]